MNALFSVGLAPLLFISSALAQDGTTINGGMAGYEWIGGYGGFWAPIVAFGIAVILAVWMSKQQGK